MSTIQKVSALLAAGVWVSAVAVGQPQPAVAKAVADAFGPSVTRWSISARRRFNTSTTFPPMRSTGRWTATSATRTRRSWASSWRRWTCPPGREIVTICTYFFDTAPVGKVTTYLDAIKLADITTGPAVVPVWGPVENDIDTGHGGGCT